MMTTPPESAPSKIWLRLGTKLSLLVMLTLLPAIALLAWQGVRFFRQDNSALVQQMNLEMAQSFALRVKQVLQTAVMRLGLEDPSIRVLRFNEAPDRSGPFWAWLNSDSTMKTLATGQPAFGLVKDDEWSLVVALPAENGALAKIGLFPPKEIAQIFEGTAGVAGHLLGSDGRDWFRPEVVFPVPGRGVLQFKHGADLAAMAPVGNTGLITVSEIPESIALSSSERFARLATWLAIAILGASLIVAGALATRLVRPIRDLTEASLRLSAGDFSACPTPVGGDEIAVLTRAFNSMVAGLRERHLMKASIGKFINPEVVRQLLAGKLKMGGERKKVAVLFTDLRAFTPMSETLSPEQTVHDLNEYLSRMVAVIQRHGGIVDKFVGDAIVAVWGLPYAEDHDLQRALAACLDMRLELQLLNEDRKIRGSAPLAMGMGLHFGPVLAGYIGSADRMEYTVTGDVVNTASRIEAQTKELSTDLLVSEEVKEIVTDAFIFGVGSEVELKGKSKPLRLYFVLGMNRGSRRAA